MERLSVSLGTFLKRAGIPQEAATAPLPEPRPRTTFLAGTKGRPDQFLPLEPGICPACHGIGLIDGGGPIHDDGPLEDGFEADDRGKRMITVPCPGCTADNDPGQYDRLRRYSGLPVGAWSFDGYRAVNDEAGAARDAVRAWANGESEQPWLFLLGSPGTGKTRLAFAAADTLLRRGIPAAVHVAPELIEAFKQAIGADQRAANDRDLANAMHYADLRARLMEAAVVVLDDLGTEKSTEFAEERLYEIINHRYAERKPLIVTTNAAPDTLDSRIVSRLRDRERCLRIRMAWADYRNTPLEDRG